MISYAINNAKKSKCFDKIIVSTDNEQIAKISKKYGAEVPFVRPKKLSNNFTALAPVISHAISELKRKKYYSRSCMCSISNNTTSKL